MKNSLTPQDIVILLKIVSKGNVPWHHHTLAKELGISQSEVSQSLSRSSYAGLVDVSRKKINHLALMEFLVHGLGYVFPGDPAQ